MFETSYHISVLPNRPSVLPNKVSVSTKQGLCFHQTGPRYMFACIFIRSCLNPEKTIVVVEWVQQIEDRRTLQWLTMDQTLSDLPGVATYFTKYSTAIQSSEGMDFMQARAFV